MVDPASGPFVFDTSAESWLARSRDPAMKAWLAAYLDHHRVHVSAITVLERMKGYGLLVKRSQPEARARIQAARKAYLTHLSYVLPLNTAVAVVASEITILLPSPASPPKRSHQLTESRCERLVRWRFDILIAATALVAGLPLVHNNPEDFEAIRGAIERVPQRFPGLSALNLIQCLRLAAG